MTLSSGWITLSEALSWLVFGTPMARGKLLEKLAQQDFSEKLQADLEYAVIRFTNKARLGEISVQGRLAVQRDGQAHGVLTENIPSEKFADFTAFDITTDGLRYGRGLFWLPRGLSHNEWRVVTSERPEHYVDVEVNSSDLMQALQKGQPKSPSLPQADLQKWWCSLTIEQKKRGETAHKMMLEEAYPDNHVSRERLRTLRSTIPRSRGRTRKSPKK